MHSKMRPNVKDKVVYDLYPGFKERGLAAHGMTY